METVRRMVNVADFPGGVPSSSSVGVAPGPVASLSRIDQRVRQLFKSGMLGANSSKRIKVQQWQPGLELAGHRDGVLEVAACPFDPRLVATGSADRTACIWSLPTRSVVAYYSGHRGVVNSVRFHSSMPLVCTGSGDGTCHILKLPNAVVDQEKRQSEVGIDLDALSGDEDRTGGDDTTAAAIEEIRKPRDRALSDSIQGTKGPYFQFRRQSETNVPETRDSPLAVRMRDRSSSQPNITIGIQIQSYTTELQGHAGPVSCADWVANSDMIASGSWDCQCIIWQVGTGERRMLQRLKGNSLLSMRIRIKV
jgi:WD40 repeat protein